MAPNRSALRRLAARPYALIALMLTALALTLGPLRWAGAGEPRDSCRFGVFPYMPVLTIDQIFGPMAASFAQDLGRPVYLKTKSTFEKFAEELMNQTYDIILVHPFFYIDVAARAGYRPLARVDDELTGVAMIKAEQPWKGWRDLEGRVLALPPELSAVSELVKAALSDAGLRPEVDVMLRYYGTKMACLQAVVTGSADACALPRFVLSQIGSIADLKLKEMVETEPISHLVIAVHSRVPEADQAKLLADILSWPRTARGREILAAGAWPGFVAARDDDYDEIRRDRARHARKLSSLSHR
ncbi:MAG TPA: phosphate/phosphite/phosphonate ABC transporter substrate-binding protein [Geminicoccaceae bacterium]|nr:phosphate/phosphite/phosphonate ABC transporter substrate-binding protein [Geminicoccaceae bacterium]